jgi:mRNA interferase YafQ
MLVVELTAQFKKDLKLAKKSNKPVKRLKQIVLLLQKREALPKALKDHRLKGKWKDFRELHIQPDWLLIYQLLTKENVLLLVRLGSHSELFN